MEPLIVFFWFLLLVAIPLFLIVSVYVELRAARDSKRLWVAGIGLVVHILLVCLTFFPMFLIIYIGAHTNPVGEVLSYATRLIILSAEVLYLALFISVSTFIAGRERPWPLKIPNPLK